MGAAALAGRDIGQRSAVAGLTTGEMKRDGQTAEIQSSSETRDFRLARAYARVFLNLRLGAAAVINLRSAPHSTQIILPAARQGAGCPPRTPASTDHLSSLHMRLHSVLCRRTALVELSILCEGAHKAAASSHRSASMVMSSDGGAVPTKPFSASVTPPMSSRLPRPACVQSTASSRCSQNRLSPGS